MRHDVLEIIESFNRKERYFVVAQATTVDGRLRLSEEFRDTLGERTALTIPDDALVFIDYHFDWLYAARRMAEGLLDGKAAPNVNGAIKGNQEDIDLLVGFRQGSDVHLVLVEAKGETSWSNKQLVSKLDRLTSIFGEDGCGFPGVVPHFVIWSPRESEKIDHSAWHDWMKRDGEVPWLKLAVPQPRRSVARTDAAGKPSRSGGHLTVSVSRPTVVD